jgi:hypothetical protein
MNLFIISTPSQAFFLAQSPELIKNAVLVVTVPNKRIASKIHENLKDFNFEYSSIVYITKLYDKLVLFKIFYFKIWFIQFKLRFKTFENIYIGSYSNFYHLSIIGEYENYSKIFLLYDGMQLMSVAYNRLTAKDKVRSLPTAFTALGFKQPLIKSLNFVSPFFLRVHPNDSSVILQNNNNFNHPKLVESEVIVVGQPLEQLKIVSEKFYLRCLQDIIQKFPNKKVFYVPHPRENNDSIAKISSILEIKSFGKIFEEEYLRSSVFPQTVISFYSSVLGNMAFLKTSTKLYAIAIPEANFRRKELYENYKLTLKFLKKQGVQVINNL